METTNKELASISSEINRFFTQLENNAAAPVQVVPTSSESSRPEFLNADKLHYRHHNIYHLANSWLQKDCLILDTEATGLGSDAEICEISVIDSSGNVLLNSLVRPTKPIPDEVIRIHGITNEMVANAPTWRELHDDFLQLIGNSGRPLVIYNAQYDVRLLIQSAHALGFSFPHSFPSGYNIHCAMQAYSEFYGAWDDCRHAYKWQKLTNAIVQCGFPVLDAHRALGDCIMTLAVIRHMAGQSK